MRMVYVIMLTLAHSLPTIVINSAHFIARLVLGDDALEPYRWQSGRRPPAALVQRCVMYVAAFHLLVPLLPYVLYEHAIAFHPTLMTDCVPGILTMLVQFVVAYLCTDTLFYWGHRALHVPVLYRWIHKQHHQFYVTIGLAAEYAHPVELLMGNIIPVMFAGVAFRYQLGTLCTWMMLAMSGTTFQHSGFKFPLAPSNPRHDFHHSHVVCNFGSLPIWDYICGTNKEWLRYLEQEQIKTAERQRAVPKGRPSTSEGMSSSSTSSSSRGASPVRRTASGNRRRRRSSSR